MLFLPAMSRWIFISITKATEKDMNGGSMREEWRRRDLMCFSGGNIGCAVDMKSVQGLNTPRFPVLMEQKHKTQVDFALTPQT